MIVDVPGIPLPRRDGTLRYALVDPDDFVWLNVYRWHAHSDIERPYVVRSASDATGRRFNVYMHREIMLLGHANEDERVVDHINGNALDNRRSNLRVVTREQNAQNQRSRTVATSRFRGVSWDRGKWVAQCHWRRRNYFLGYYDREEDAAEASAAFRRERMPYAVDEEAAA